MAYKFELYTDKAGETRFRFKAPNGEIMFGSEGYKQKKSAQRRDCIDPEERRRIDGRRQHRQVTKHTAIIGPAHRALPRRKAGDFE